MLKFFTDTKVINNLLKSQLLEFHENLRKDITVKNEQFLTVSKFIIILQIL